MLFRSDLAPTLTLEKQVIGGDAQDTDWTLEFTGPDNGSGAEGDAAITNASVSAGQYTLSESGGPAGYEEAGWSCSGMVESVLAGNVLTLAPGEDVTCEVTNVIGTAFLTLAKDVTNDDGGDALDTDWTLAFDGLVDDGSGVEGDAAITDAEVTVGPYTLSESNGPAGYQPDG